MNRYLVTAAGTAAVIFVSLIIGSLLRSLWPF